MRGGHLAAELDAARPVDFGGRARATRRQALAAQLGAQVGPTANDPVGRRGRRAGRHNVPTHAWH
eukprot:1119435-Pyramimonas_sp.AAC.1